MMQRVSAQSPAGPERALPCAPPALGLLYAALIALSTLRGYFHLVELPWFVTQLSFAAIILLAAAWVCYAGATQRVNRSVNMTLLEMLPTLLMLVWSVGLWVIRQDSLALILRGSSMLLYQLLLLAMLAAAGILFGRRAVEYTAIGFLLANTLILLDVMRRFGVGATISGMVTFLAGLGSADNAISISLEVQDLTFGIAILLMYYLAAGKGEHGRWYYAAALGFFFLLGFKRILFPAILVGALYFLLAQRMPKREQRGFSAAVGILLSAVCLGFVVLIRSGEWVEICRRLGIDLMGRARLYGYMQNYYEISPTYFGIGSGRISTILEVLEKTGNRRLHSDVLRLYIELGMPAFLGWCFLTYVFLYLHMESRYSGRVAGLYMAATLLMAVTFLTDNTLEKFCPQIAWNLLPLAAALGEQEDTILKLRQAPLLKAERKPTWSKPKRTPVLTSEAQPETEESPAQALRRYRMERQRKRS